MKLSKNESDSHCSKKNQDSNAIALVYTYQQLQYAKEFIGQSRLNASIFFISKDNRIPPGSDEIYYQISTGYSKANRLIAYLRSAKAALGLAKKLNSFILICPHLREVAANRLHRLPNCKQLIMVQDGTSNLFDPLLTNRQKITEIIKFSLYNVIGVRYALRLGTYLRMDLFDGVVLQFGYPKLHPNTIFVSRPADDTKRFVCSKRIIFVGQENLYTNSGEHLEYFREKIEAALSDDIFSNTKREYIPRYVNSNYDELHNAIPCETTRVDGVLEDYIVEVCPEAILSFTSTALINIRLRAPHIKAYYIPIKESCYKAVHNTSGERIQSVFREFGINKL